MSSLLFAKIILINLDHTLANLQIVNVLTRDIHFQSLHNHPITSPLTTLIIFALNLSFVMPQ